MVLCFIREAVLCRRGSFTAGGLRGKPLQQKQRGSSLMLNTPSDIRQGMCLCTGGGRVSESSAAHLWQHMHTLRQLACQLKGQALWVCPGLIRG